MNFDFNLDELENLDMADFTVVSSNDLSEADEKAITLAEGKEQAEFFVGTVLPAMEALRLPIDTLENMVDKKLWPVPAYGDMLFEV